MSRSVDPQATYNYSVGVRDSMYTPKPPAYQPDKQGPGEEIGEALGKHLADQDLRFQQRTDFR